MGAQFQVDVNVVTHGAEKVNELEQKLSKMQNKSVDIKVNVDGLDKLDTSKLNKQFNVASKELSKSFSFWKFSNFIFISSLSLSISVLVPFFFSSIALLNI